MYKLNLGLVNSFLCRIQYYLKICPIYNKFFE